MPHKQLLPILMLIPCVTVFSESAKAGEVFIGLTAQQSSIDIDEDDTQVTLAELNSKLYYSPALAIRSESNYFHENTHLGYFLEFNSGYYIVNRQVLNGSIGSTVNLNTSLSGLYWDLTPTIFYNFGNKKKENWDFKTGIGFGIGYFSVSGSAVLTEQAGQPLVTFDDDGYGLTVGLYLEATKNDWFFQIKGYGPGIEVGNYDLVLANVRMTIGKKFNF